jgi:hypothetical protein
MTTLRTLKKLFLGETWLLPVGLGMAIVGSFLIRHLLDDTWHRAGGFILLVAIIAVLLVSTGRSATPR